MYMPKSPKDKQSKYSDSIEGKDQKEDLPGTEEEQQDAQKKVLNSPCLALSLGGKKDKKREIVSISEDRY